MPPPILRAYRKAAGARLDYAIDWATLGWLVGGDTLASASWSVPAGITKLSESASGTVATVWLAGGSVGVDYDVTCRIVTVGGRKDERTLRIQVRAPQLLRTHHKDPGATLDYSIDWAALGWLVGADTVASGVWTLPSGLTFVSDTHSPTSTTVWLEGGVAGNDYDVVCHVTTVGGREDERLLRLEVRQL